METNNYSEHPVHPIEFRNGKIFVEGVETIDAELIGLAILDFNEQHDGSHIGLIATRPAVMAGIIEMVKRNDCQYENSLQN